MQIEISTRKILDVVGFILKICFYVAVAAIGITALLVFGTLAYVTIDWSYSLFWKIPLVVVALLASVVLLIRIADGIAALYYKNPILRIGRKKTDLAKAKIVRGRK